MSANTGMPGVFLRAIALLAWACLSGELVAQDGPSFLREPVVEANINKRAPLVAFVKFTASAPATAVVNIRGEGETRELAFKPEVDPTAGLPLLGLPAGKRFEVQVSLKDARGRITAVSRKLTHVTARVPEGRVDFPPMQLRVADVARQEPGYFLLSVRRRALGRAVDLTPAQTSFMLDWGLLLALDTRGRVVWYYESPDRIAGIARLKNGNILYNTADGVAREIDLLGNVQREIVSGRARERGASGLLLDARVIHHLPHELPDGNFLLFTAEQRRLENSYLDEFDPALPRGPRDVVGDVITIVDNNDGRKLWTWNTFDFLDTNRIGYTEGTYWWTRGFPGSFDWTHGNGVYFDAKNDAVVFGLKFQDAIFSVNRTSKKINWILGEPTDWGALGAFTLKPVGQPFRWPWRMHNPRVSHKGTVVVFDNGTHEARPPRTPKPPHQVFSRGVEYEVDPVARTVRQVWASDDSLTADSCHAMAMGDAWRLPRTDNMLVIFGACIDMRPGVTISDLQIGPKMIPANMLPQHSRIVEYTRETPARKVFDLRFEDPYQLVQWQTFGGEKLASLYPHGMLAAESAGDP